VGKIKNTEGQALSVGLLVDLSPLSVGLLVDLSQYGLYVVHLSKLSVTLVLAVRSSYACA